MEHIDSDLKYIPCIIDSILDTLYYSRYPYFI